MNVEFSENIFVNFEVNHLITLILINVVCDNIEWNYLGFQNSKILLCKMLFTKFNMHLQDNTEDRGIKKVFFLFKSFSYFL